MEGGLLTSVLDRRRVRIWGPRVRWKGSYELKINPHLTKDGSNSLLKRRPLLELVRATVRVSAVVMRWTTQNVI
jgi:hypothetical protein